MVTESGYERCTRQSPLRKGRPHNEGQRKDGEVAGESRRKRFVCRLSIACPRTDCPDGLNYPFGVGACGGS